MTQLRDLGWFSRAVLSVIFGITLTMVFVALGLLGTVAFGRWGIILAIPVLPGVALAYAFHFMGTGPEQIIPTIYANFAVYSLTVFAIWEYRRRRPQQHRTSQRPPANDQRLATNDRPTD